MFLYSNFFVFPSASIRETSPCVLWPRPPAPALIDSIQKLGQLEPLLVRREKGQMTLVSGYSRLLALRELERDAVCLEINGSAQDGALAYLRANCGRTLDDSMRLVALRFFKNQMSDARLETEILPLIGIDSRAKSWRWWQEWLQFASEFDCLLYKGHLPLAAAPAFAALSEEERLFLLPWLRAVYWSRSNACNLLIWLYEASRLHGKDLVQLLQKSDFSLVLAKDLSPKDMSAAILLEAKKLRYPNFFSLQGEVQKKLRPLIKGSVWQVEHEDNFETSSLSLRCKLKNKEEAKRACKELERIAEYWESAGE